MGRRLIIQEDGKFAFFSSIVDNLVVYDATLEELVADARKDAADKAEEEIRALCAKEHPWHRHFKPEEAVEWVRSRHGDEEAELTRKRLAGEPHDGSW